MPIAGFNFFRIATSGGGTGGGGGGGSGGGFTPYQELYILGSGTSIVPGAVQLIAECYGAGGSGGTKNSSTGKGGGGGSGAYCKITLPVAAGDHGKTITWNTDNSGPATVVGDATGTNLTNTALNLSAGNGTDGVTTTPGSGGTATGGSTNINGNSATGSTGASAPGPAGGLGGAGFTDGTDPGAGGGGGNNNTAPGSGANPRIILTWS